jgi:tetratricopeptide (TPR) repeat protein
VKRILVSCILLTVAVSAAWADASADCAQYKDFELQIRACSALIKQNPRNAAAFYNRGMAYYIKAVAESFGSMMEGGKGESSLPQYNKAFQDFTKAIEINPAYVEAYWGRAQVRSGRNENERAIMEDYDKAVKADPGNAEVYNKRGDTYYGNGKIDSALADYNKAIEIKPKYAEALINRGSIYEKKGDDVRAFQDYDRAVEADPQYSLAYVVRGEAYEKKGDKQRAIADFRKALSVDPERTSAKDGLDRLGVTP